MSEVKKLRRLPRKKKTVNPANIAHPILEDIFTKMREIQDAALAGRETFLKLEQQALFYMREHKLDTYDRGPFKGTPVYGSTEVIDWDGLKKKLPEHEWSQLLGQPQPDKDKLAALMELDIVSADVVKEFISDKPSKPYVKITTRS